MTQYKTIDTTAVHGGEPEPRINGAVAMPIFQSATFLYEGETDYHATKYVRLNNTPNHDALHRKLAALENAEAALVTGSGMAAISTALLGTLAAGDHLLIVDCPYGGTRSLVAHELPRLGITCTFIDGNDPSGWEQLLQPTTGAIYVETITNPLMEVPDLRAVVEFAKRHNLVSLIDNTFASPVNFRPAEHGFDLSLHSGTKYLNGHTDVAAGAIIGRRSLIERLLLLLNHLGGMLDPHACFLLHRGLKTLPLRVRHQNQSAMRIATFLDEHVGVARVNHPGLSATAGHARACELFDGFGGMISFELHGDVDTAERFMNALTIPIVAVSLGGVESLIVRPAVTAYANIEPQERQRLGVSDRLIRLSVGIEDTDELIGDLQQALESVAVSSVA